MIRYIVVAGTMFGDKKVYGVFEDKDHLYQWVAVHLKNQLYEVVEMEPIQVTFNDLRRSKGIDELKNKLTHNYNCEFCGIYRAKKQRCNKCENEK